VAVHSDLLRKLLNWTTSLGSRAWEVLVVVEVKKGGSLGGPKEAQGVAVVGILVVGTPPAAVAADDDDLDPDDGEGARSCSNSVQDQEEPPHSRC